MLNWLRRQSSPSRTKADDPSQGPDAPRPLPQFRTEEGSPTTDAPPRYEEVDLDVKRDPVAGEAASPAPGAGAVADPPKARPADAGEADDREVAAGDEVEVDHLNAPLDSELLDTTTRDTTLRRDSAVVVCVANQKGGVGKTTTAVSLAAALAEAGAQVLLVDLDPQGNATTGLGFRVEEGDPSTYAVLIDAMAIEDATRTTAIAGLGLVPSSLDLAGAEIELVPAFAREARLRRALEGVRDRYQVVIVDCPPTLGLLTVNALVAADLVLLPIQCEYYALEGVGQLLQSLDLVRSNLNESLKLGGVILTMFDGRTRLSQQVVDEVRRHFGAQVFRTVIPRSVRLSEAPSFGEPITTFDPASRGARAYFRLAGEFAERLGLGLRLMSPLDRFDGEDETLQPVASHGEKGVVLDLEPDAAGSSGSAENEGAGNDRPARPAPGAGSLEARDARAGRDGGVRAMPDGTGLNGATA